MEKKSESPFDSLSTELIKLILGHIEPDTDKTVPIDSRRFLSVESFDHQRPPLQGTVRDIHRFRSVCRRFAELGAPLLFTRVGARFSAQGLSSLEELARWPHLTKHVKKFSYLVPYFYGDADRLQRQAVNGISTSRDLRLLQEKAREQRQIVDSREDVRVLKKAIASFSSLQFIQLLRVEDAQDKDFRMYIQREQGLRQFVEQYWVPACSHGSRTIGAALLSANVPWSRFSSQVLSARSAESLALYEPDSLSILASRLTCLTLHFDEVTDLDQRIGELSNLFKTVFATAEAMQAVHVGFPSDRPLNLPLERVFHEVVWKKLVALGVNGWNLDADEIVDLALRHRQRLKGLRLRHVHLRPGSIWKDVLGKLRDSMLELEWVSLRKIDYMDHFDDTNPGGAEITDDLFENESDSETDEDEDGAPGLASRPTSSDVHPNGHLDPHTFAIAGPSATNQYTNGSMSVDEDSDGHTDSDEGHGPESVEMDFPEMASADTPASAPWCNCNGHSDSADDIGDNGRSVSNAQRKAWEKWVIRRCPEHGEQ